MKQIDPVSRRGGRGARSTLKAMLALAFLIGAAVCGNAWARPGEHGHAQGSHGDGFHGNQFHGNGFHGHGFHDHGRARPGVAIGAPFWWYGPGWYGGPYSGYPYPYAMPPVGYVERGATLWYYCASPQGYYPYVKECGTDWRVVVPESVTP